LAERARLPPGREAEFGAASDSRRCAWAWRRYVSAVRSSGVSVAEVRYERMATEPAVVAGELANALGVSQEAAVTALGEAHAESVGRWRSDLSPGQLADVEAEAGTLLRELGYLS
jgi:LPS sulfotransferase NodH